MSVIASNVAVIADAAVWQIPSPYTSARLVESSNIPALLHASIRRIWIA